MSEGPEKHRRQWRFAYSLQAMFIAVTIAAVVAGLSTNPPSLIVEGLSLAFPKLVLAAAASGVVLWIGIGVIVWNLVSGRLETRYRFVDSRQSLTIVALVAMAATLLWALKLSAIIEYNDSLYRGLQMYTTEERRNFNDEIRTLKFELQDKPQPISENPISD